MKSMVENIPLDLPGSILPGHLIMPAVRIEPSQALPSSPRNGPALPPSGHTIVFHGPLSLIHTTIVSSSMPPSAIASSTRPELWSSSMTLSP